MTAAVKFASQHVPTDSCGDDHCLAHGVDEVHAGAYAACPDCNHAYPTARDLRAAYRSVHRRYCGLRFCGMFVLARTVHFCPACGRDGLS